MKNISLIAFDDFTDIDLWLMWDLLKRVKNQDWNVKILGTKESHTSQTGIQIQMHGHISEANTADVVLFVSGPGTRKIIKDESFLSALRLDSSKQIIGSMCSGALVLAALNILNKGDKATTYPTAKSQLEEFEITVVEEKIVINGNVATAAGCLAAQDLIGWVMENIADRALRDTVLSSIRPVGDGLYFQTKSLEGLYSNP